MLAMVDEVVPESIAPRAAARLAPAARRVFTIETRSIIAGGQKLCQAAQGLPQQRHIA
jgi:hypothetical protein